MVAYLDRSLLAWGGSIRHSDAFRVCLLILLSHLRNVACNPFLPGGTCPCSVGSQRAIRIFCHCVLLASPQRSLTANVCLPQLASRLGVSSYPYCALLAFSGSRLAMLCAMPGTRSPQQLLTALHRSVDRHSTQMAAEQADHNQQVSSQRIRTWARRMLGLVS